MLLALGHARIAGGARLGIGEGNHGTHGLHSNGSERPRPGVGIPLSRRSSSLCILEAVDTYDPAEIVERLAALRAEHRLLDEQITRMAANGEDELESKRLKRRKLQLKDCIARLESLQIPDEPA